VWRKRRRYVFRKRRLSSHILWPVIGIVVVVALIWFMPWSALSSVDAEDASKVEISKDQPEQAFTKDPPELVAMNDQPEQQESAEDQPEVEDTPKDNPPKQEGISNKLLSSSPLPAQPSLPSPPAPSPPRVEEVPKSYLPPDDYWYYEPDYSNYESDYWYYESDYWDY
jgi:hypothetical protein